MAKYCSKCGKALPDGVDVCPDCHGREEKRDGAALFTKMTAETEVWKEEPKPGKTRKQLGKLISMKERLMLYLAAVLLVIFTVFVIDYTQPVTRASRAIAAGDYDKAMSIYTEKLAEKPESKLGRLGRALEAKAGEICDEYGSGEITARRAEELFAGLYAFGINSDGLDARHLELETLEASRSLFDRAEGLRNGGDYLEAADMYLTVGEDDPDYETAQTELKACLSEYSASVAQRAEELMAENNFQGALSELKAGNDALMSYGTFGDEIDKKLAECCNRYESFVISEAESLAALEKYTEAAQLIKMCIDSPVGETEVLASAYEAYLALAENATSTDAERRAEELYASGDYAGAFKELETAAMLVEEPDHLQKALAGMEKRYASDMTSKARQTAAGGRDKVPEAIKQLQEAALVRRLPEIDECITELESFLPLDLITAVFSERDGEVFRSTGDFISLDGTTYVDGWFWGANGASISYETDGKYDALEGRFASRRDDGKNVSASFEVWCDGEKVYTSATLGHTGDTLDISVDISGAKTVKIVFNTSYSTVTGEGGYCYHGICAPQLVKSMDSIGG